MITDPMLNDRVRATGTVREVSVGDLGTIKAAWKRKMPYVVWDKDGVGRLFHCKRMERVSGD